MNAAILRETMALLRWLERRGSEPFTVNDLGVLWFGVDRRTGQRRLRAMVAAGWCEQVNERQFGGRRGCDGARYVATLHPSEPADGPGPRHYRGFTLWYDPPPIPTRAHDWHFAPDDRDMDDPRTGSAPTIEACRDRIDELEDM